MILTSSPPRMSKASPMIQKGVRISSSAQVLDHAAVYGQAMLAGPVKIGGTSIVRDDAMVIGAIRIQGNVVLEGRVRVYTRAILEGDVNVSSGRIRDVHWWRNIP